jgi:hypothetical protein
MTAWTPENVAAFKEAFSKGGMRAARRVFPDVSEKALYKRGSLLGIQRRPQWTPEEEGTLRKFWRRVGPRTLMEKLPDRPWGGIYSKAIALGLPMGLPQGYVSIAEAARRAGWSAVPFLRELRRAGVRIRRYIGVKAPTAMRMRPHLFVEPDEAEVVAHALANLENVTYGARARGVCAPHLRAWLKAKGHKPPKRERAFWRVESALLNEGAAWLEKAVSMRVAATQLGTQPQHVARCLTDARAAGQPVLTLGVNPTLLHVEDVRPHMEARAARVRARFLAENDAKLAAARADALARRREAKSLWRWGGRAGDMVVLLDAGGFRRRLRLTENDSKAQCSCCLRPVWRPRELVWVSNEKRVCRGCVTRLEKEHGQAGDGDRGAAREAAPRGGGERRAETAAGAAGG